MRAGVVGALVCCAASSAFGQLPSASAAALAMGGAYSARARGFNAVAWNPAGLGMGDNPRFSMTAAAVQGLAGLGPVGISQFRKYQGDTVPRAVREEWLTSIEDAGGLTGAAFAGLTEVAFSHRNVGFQMGTRAGFLANLGPGAAELIFFGNAGRTGDARDIVAAGSMALAAATTSFAVSYGRSLRASGRPLSAGITAKYTMGHLLAFAFDAGTVVSTTPIAGQVFFPLVQSRTSGGILDNLNNGSGIGLDLGSMYVAGSWTFAATIENVVNTFRWDPANFQIRFNLVDIASGATDFSAHDLSEFPELADAIEGLKYKPVVGLGVAWDRGPWTVASDFRRRTDEEGLEGGALNTLGAGVEWRRWNAFPLMVGATWSSDNFSVAGGFSARIPGLTISAGAGLAVTESGSDPVLGLTLSYGTR